MYVGDLHMQRQSEEGLLSQPELSKQSHCAGAIIPRTYIFTPGSLPVRETDVHPIGAACQRCSAQDAYLT